MTTTTTSSPELLQLTYRPDLNLLVGRWGFQPDDMALLPLVYEQLAATALNHGSRRWLQDIRRRTLNDPATTRWLTTDYFPSLARQLGGRLSVAYLASPTLLSIILNTPGFLLPEAYTDQPFSLAFFSDEGQAVRWLYQQHQ